MSIFHRKPRRDAKFVYVALDGETHKAHLWPGDTFNLNDKSGGDPVLKISYLNGAWNVEQLAPFLILDRNMVDWAAKKSLTRARA